MKFGAKKRPCTPKAMGPNRLQITYILHVCATNIMIMIFHLAMSLFFRRLAHCAIDSNNLTFMVLIITVIQYGGGRHKKINTFITLDTREHDVFIVMRSNNNNWMRDVRWCLIYLLHR